VKNVLALVAKSVTQTKRSARNAAQVSDSIRFQKDVRRVWKMVATVVKGTYPSVMHVRQAIIFAKLMGFAFLARMRIVRLVLPIYPHVNHASQGSGWIPSLILASLVLALGVPPAVLILRNAIHVRKDPTSIRQPAPAQWMRTVAYLIV